MRFILLLFFAFIHGCSCTGVLANTLKAKSQKDAAYSEVFRMEVPANQLTKTGDKKFLVETGNDNLLKNPDFEAESVGGDIPGWTIGSDVSANIDSTYGFTGNSLAITLPPGTFTNKELVSQTYTAENSSLVGSNLQHSIRIKKSSVNAAVKLKACVHIDGVEGYCQSLSDDPTTEMIQYPMNIQAKKPSTSITPVSYKVGIYATYSSMVGFFGAINVDNAKFGPKDIAMGTIQTDPVAFTPTGNLTTNVTYTGTWSQQGRYLEQETTLTFTGTNTQSFLTVNLPPGMIIDSGSTGINITSLVTDIAISGKFTGATSNYNLRALTNGTNNSFNVFFINTDTTVSTTITPAKYNGVNPASNLPEAIASGTKIYIKIKVPIQGWTSGARKSDNYDGQVIIARVDGSTSQSIPNGTFVKLTAAMPSSAAFDSLNGASWDGVNKVFKILSSGYYKVGHSLRWPVNASGSRVSAIQIDGVGQTDLNMYQPSPVDSTFAAMGGSPRYFTAGQTVGLVAYQTSGAALDVNGTIFTIEKSSGSAFISPVASVSMRAHNVSQQTISANTETVITGWTKEDDTHGVLNAAAGVATVAEDGTYSGIASLFFTNPASGWANTNSIEIYVTVNGTRRAGGYYVFRTASSVYSDVVHAPFTGLKLKRGDIINVRVYIGGVSGSVQLPNNSSLNKFSLTRTGP